MREGGRDQCLSKRKGMANMAAGFSLTISKQKCTSQILEM